MARKSPPPQYAVVLGFLNVSADLFCNLICNFLKELTVKLPHSSPLAWNSQPARFEIITYLLFWLWYSLKLHHHDSTVTDEITDYCEAEIVEQYKAAIQECPNLPAVIDRRLEIYTSTVNDHVDEGWGVALSAVHKVLANCLASSANRVQADCYSPLVIGGFDAWCLFVSGLDTIDFQVPFGCGLKHLFAHCTNITTVPVDEMLKHIREGVAEHAQICRDAKI
jgi:hypothetical protein